jgi:Na+/proline symporter
VQFLLNLPSPISFFIVSAITTFFALAGLYLVRKKYSADVLKENHEVAAIIFNAFGLFYGVLLAFVVFVTWSGYDDATKNLQLEANEAADIFHITTVFPEPSGEMLRQALLDYVTSVHNDELQRMSQGEISLHSNQAMRKLITIFYQLDEKSVPNREIYAEALKRLNNLAEYRRLRIFAGNDTVPPVIWLVLLVGSVISVLYTYFFGMKNLRAQYLIAASLTVTITMILFLIYVLDHPFTGPSRVSMEPLNQVMKTMQKRHCGASTKLLTPLFLRRFPFALSLGHSAQLRFAHRFVHSLRSAFERRLGAFTALGRERGASRHLLLL